MTRDKLLQLIKESRQLLKTARPEQKIRLLKLIKESYLKLKENVEQDEKLPWILVESQDSYIADANTQLLRVINNPCPKFPSRDVFAAKADPGHRASTHNQQQLAEYTLRHQQWKSWKSSFDEFAAATETILSENKNGYNVVDNISRLYNWRQLFLESVGVRVIDESVASINEVKDVLKKYFTTIIPAEKLKPGMLVDAITIQIDKAPKEVNVGVHSAHKIKRVSFDKDSNCATIETEQGLGPLPSSWNDDLTDIEVIFVEKPNTASQQATALALETSEGWNGWAFSILDDSHMLSKLNESINNQDYLEEK